MLSTTSNLYQRPAARPLRLPATLLAPRSCCHHGHGGGDTDSANCSDDEDRSNSLLPERIDRLALDNDTEDESLPGSLTGTQFFSSLLLPSIVRLPAIPSEIDPPKPGESLDLQPYWSMFKQVQSIRSTLNQHVIDRAFKVYAHDRPAYHAEFQQVMAQAMSTLGTVHRLLRRAGLLPPAGSDASLLPAANSHLPRGWNQLCQHVHRVQELERERMSITIKWQELVAESLHGARDVQEEADHVKRLRDVVVDCINEALEEAQAWYAELDE